MRRFARPRPFSLKPSTIAGDARWSVALTDESGHERFQQSQQGTDGSCGLSVVQGGLRSIMLREYADPVPPEHGWLTWLVCCSRHFPYHAVPGLSTCWYA